MSKEYFELFGILLGMYGFFRVIIGWQWYFDLRLRKGSRSSNIEGQPIDLSRITQRLEEVRRDYATEAQAHAALQKQPQLVAERRAEIAKLAFFQKPPPEAERPEQEHGSPLFFAL